MSTYFFMARDSKHMASVHERGGVQGRVRNRISRPTKGQVRVTSLGFKVISGVRYSELGGLIPV